MTSDGVIKVRTYCRKPDDERWDSQELDLAKGVPWEPIPGRGRIQVKSRVKIMDESGERIGNHLSGRSQKGEVSTSTRKM